MSLEWEDQVNDLHAHCPRERDGHECVPGMRLDSWDGMTEKGTEGERLRLKGLDLLPYSRQVNKALSDLTEQEEHP